MALAQFDRGAAAGVSAVEVNFQTISVQAIISRPSNQQMIERLNNLDLRTKIGGFLFGFAGLGGFLSFIVVERWAHNAPMKPNLVLGQLYPHNEHGWITYFTAFQATSSDFMFWATFASAVIAIATIPKQRVVVRRWGGMPLAARWEYDDKKGFINRSAYAGAAFAPFAFFVIGPPIVAALNNTGIVFNL